MGRKDTQTAPLSGRFHRALARRLVLCACISVIALTGSPAIASASSEKVVPPAIVSLSAIDTFSGTTVEFTLDTDCYRILYTIEYGLERYEEHTGGHGGVSGYPEYQTVSQLITGLAPGKTYMYRLDITSVFRGELREGTFTTPVLPVAEINPESQEASGEVS